MNKSNNIKPHDNEPVIMMNNITTKLGGKLVHENLDISINRGEIVAIVGGSGTGKSTILREILALQTPTSGEVKVFGKPLSDYSMNDMMHLRHRCGVLFQQGALFSGLTVLENVAFPLHELKHLSQHEIDEVALLKIVLAGLEVDAALKYPAELSGGMLKRAALARAIVMDPELLFLDEPTAGLDPISAAALDDLLLQLHEAFGLTIIMVTHDLDTLSKVIQRIIFLGEGKVLASGSYAELSENKHPLIHEYFHNARARAVTELRDQ